MDLNKMKKGYHKMAGELRDLERRIEQAESEKRTAVAEAVANVVAEVQVEVDALRADLVNHSRELQTAGVFEISLKELVKSLRQQIAEQNALYERKLTEAEQREQAASGKCRDYKERLDQMQPALDTLDQCNAELTAIVERIQTRQKERDKIDTIANKRALARALFIPVPEEKS